MGFSGGGSNVTKAHTHDSTVVQDGGALAANVTQFGLTSGSILYSDGSNIQELGIGSSAEVLAPSGGIPAWTTPYSAFTNGSILYSNGSSIQELGIGGSAQVLAVSGGIPAWITNTSNPLIKVTKSYTDITALEMDIYTLPQDAALVNIWTDITTVFDVSTAVTIGDAGDDNGFTEATDWTSGTGLTDATRGAYVTSFKTMRSTSGTTAIKAYNFTSGGSTFTQSSTDYSEEINPGGSDRSQIGQRYEAGHVLIGEDVTQATFYIADLVGGAAGTVNCYIREGDGTLKATSTTTIDASTLTSSYVAHSFDFPSTTIVADDMIMVSFANGTGSNVIKVSTNFGNITNGEEWDEYNGVYSQKEIASMKQIITYATTVDTQGAVDFYLQVVD